MPREDGYKNLRPPKKGEVRNPSGRPKGARSFRAVIREALEAVQQKRSPITGQIETLSVQEQLVLALFGKAMKGDVAAFREIADRFEGKVADKIVDETPVENKKVVRFKMGDSEIEISS